MASQTSSRNRTFKTAADLSDKQYFIVKLTADNTVNLASAATDMLLGTLQNNPASGSGANADVLLRNAHGTGKVIAGGSISRGDQLTSDANGEAVATTTTDDHVLGVALTDAADGEIVEYVPSDRQVA